MPLVMNAAVVYPDSFLFEQREADNQISSIHNAVAALSDSASDRNLLR